MSRDIRAFFKVESSKKRKSSNEPENSVPNKRAALTISEDVEDKGIKKKAKKRVIEDSSDEEKKIDSKSKKKATKKEETNRKEINEKDLKSLFGGPVKRVDRPKETKVSPTNNVIDLDTPEKSTNGHHTPEKASSSAKTKSPVKSTTHENPKKPENSKKSPVKESDAKTKSSSRKESPKKNLGSMTKTSPVKSKESSKKEPDSKQKPSPVKSKESPKKSSNERAKSPLMKIVTKPKDASSEWQTTVKSSKPSTSKSNEIKPKPAPVKPMSPIKRDIQPIDVNTLSFVDKYKPKTVKEVIGQQGPSSNANKLQNWLLHWHKNHGDPKKKATKKSNPYAKNDDGSSFKAALLSGMPGIGKTTTAHLVCSELSFDVVEFNASDTRSKRALKEEVQQLLTNQSLKGYASGDAKGTSRRHVLIMDEVDGMAGNEDRGGIAELIQLIKEAQVPIICMCNDRNHSKIRSLANYCFDLRFHKPSINQIRSAMMSICFKEGIKMEPGAIDSIINGTGCDVRQTLNHLALYSASKEKKIGAESAKKTAHLSEKDVKIGPWEVIRKVFSPDDHRTMSFNDKSDLFFYDYSIAPLFVQENYLRVKPKGDKLEVLKRVAKTADSLSIGDNVDRKIRSYQAWSLLPTMAVFSSVLPGEYMEGNPSSPYTFPKWLGKNSNTNKRKRLAQEIHDHTRVATSGSRMSVRLDYAQFLVQAIVKPLIDKGIEGVPEALEVMKSYHLLREDLDSLFELTTWGDAKSPWERVDSKVKAALTRAYNKEVAPYSFSAQADVKKKKKVTLDEFGNEEESVEASDDDDEEESIEKSTMIKVKKRAEPKASKSEGAKKTTTSKAPKGKGKK